MQAERTSPSRAGRVLGATIFAAGMVMLLVVFALAALAFAQVPHALMAPRASPGPGIGRLLAVTAARAGFLLVMAYVSSLIASKGLELYQAAPGERGE